MKSAAGRIVREEIARAGLLAKGGGRTFYCVGGTWRNLARLHMNVTNYPLAVMHHYEMAPQAIGDFLKRIARNDMDKMKGIDRIAKSRRALLPYGAIVLQEILRVMQPRNIVVSALGVREGYLYSLHSPSEQRVDPLISASEEMAVLRARSVIHARELAEWTGEAFAAFGIEETEDDARYRRAACLLADTGWRAHPEYRGAQSLNIIAHGSFIGVDHPGRAFLALTNLYRHEGIYEDAAAPESLDGEAGCDDLLVDQRAREVRVDGREIELTRTEFDLLAHLVNNPGVVVGRHDLLKAVWATDFVPDCTHVVDVHLANLRRKLRDADADNQWIRTIRGVGFRYAPCCA